MAPPLLLLGALLVAAAFFSALELAYLSADRYKIDLLNKERHWQARIAAAFLANPPRFLATILLLNTLTWSVFGIKLANYTEASWYSDYANSEQPVALLLLKTALPAALFIFVGEYLPKLIVQKRPTQVLLKSARLTFFLYKMSYPAVWLVEQTIRRLSAKIAPREDASMNISGFTRGDLYNFLLEHSARPGGETHGFAADAISRTMSLHRIQVREFLIPRERINALPHTAEYADVVQMLRDTRQSRILIYKDSLDDILGYLHVTDMFEQKTPLKRKIKPLFSVGPETPASELLARFNRQRKNAAVVKDEQNRTLGVVTAVDMIKVIFGEIHDRA